MTTHLLPFPVTIDTGNEDIERTVDIDTDDAGQVWMWDRTYEVDDLKASLTTCFPTLDDAERVALRMLAAVRAARGV